ncbi:glycosyltransferase family 2 protein [Methylobacterium pseudosasicola]|uniref:Glycosyltransferase involved in cell wall bisynthesis n=1 Tax=Methylobacterium pseudosasicola TaxID=582667 RepID=A0A1I4I4Y9_9HYPH|nr:glycosyltransferase [Methylobacterium pseudosasicola]SFL48796.1 Glycosyltransferase involved in cell wall bisynthesis [Methylobacterium pseudosasicola]
MQDGAGDAAPGANTATPALEPWQDDFSTIYRSGLFDHIWYATRYPDVGLTDLSPLEHYVKYGARLGRQPRADFTAEPDESFDGSFVNPFAAWIRARAESEPAPEWNRPVVSVLCITYNQARFIRETLDSILGQVTDFPFELLVGDDRSSDGTAEIIADYAARHPNLVAVLRTENLGPNKNFADLTARCRGEYVAICEGDDYWTDSSKLQRQVEFLRANPEFTLCFHPVRVLYEDMPGVEEIYPKHSSSQPSLSDLVAHNFVQTNSVLYRWRYHGEEPFRLDEGIAPGDWYVHLMHAEVGRIGFLPQVMAVYRKHAAGMWATYATELARHKKLGNSEIAFFRTLRGHFGGRYAVGYEASQKAIFRRLAEAYLDEEDVSSLGALIDANPDIARAALHDMGLDAPDDLSGEPAALRAWLEDQLTVSVIVTAYNHAGYIRRCLDGVLAQRGLFKLQVVIGDDRSTDGTPEIVESYRARDPERITVRPRERNLGMLRNMQDCLGACTGRYIAFCEADDYWLSDRKIAMQLRMLRNDRALDMCFNWVLLHYPATGSFVPHDEQGRYPTGTISFPVLANAPLTANFSCCVYRAEALRRVPEAYYENAAAADWLMNLYVADKGRIAFLRELLSVYTIQDKGQWSGLPEDIRNARIAEYQKQFAQIFGEGRGFEKYEVGCTIAELDGELPDSFARANLETPQDRVWAEIQDGQVLLSGWVVSASRAKATLIAEVDGEVQRHPVDVHRPDVIAAVLGDMPTTMEEARCGFRLTLPYALHLEVLLSIEVEHEVVPWLSVIFTHRVKRSGQQG